MKKTLGQKVDAMVAAKAAKEAEAAAVAKVAEYQKALELRDQQEN